MIQSQAVYSEKAINLYKDEMKLAMETLFPRMFSDDIERAIDYSLQKRFTDSEAVLENNYEDPLGKNKKNTTLINVVNYIVEREPIITVSGVMFKKHGSTPNPLVMLIQEFLELRAEYKSCMFKYPKGSENFEKFNLLQSSEKTSANAIYGCLANHTSVFYNLFVATSITMQGQSCISTVILLFESMLNNNVKFGSINEVVQFINNIRREERIYDDSIVLDGDITVNECFMQVMSTCGFYYIPTEDDMMLIWDMLNQLSQEDINRIFYKNNLFWFVENKYIMNKILTMLSGMTCHFIDPNKPPEEIKEQLEQIYSLFKEYVYYPHQYMDRLDRAENMLRSVSVLTDTDSCFISFDGWYRFMLDKTYDIPMTIKEIETDEETGNTQPADVVRYDYDFFTDEVIEYESTLNPNTIGPSAGYRCTLINILAHIMGKLAIDYMSRYSNNSNSLVTVDGTVRTSYFILKNEFQLKRALVTQSKKNYCSYQERQEGSFIPKDNALDIKGMPIRKVGIPEKTARQIEDVLLNFVLNAEHISQIEIVKQLAIIEKNIFNSLMAGDKEYFKPARIKAKDAYDDPLGQFGVKAAYTYNRLKERDRALIDLNTRNSIYVIKTNINIDNIDKIKDAFPEVYENALEMLNDPLYNKTEKPNGGTIDKIAILQDDQVPEWIKPFIDYVTIINDNISNFPIEALGIDRKDKSNVNYTNIARI